MTMTKGELVAILCDRHPFLNEKTALAVLDTTFATISDALVRDGSYSMPSFGAFKVQQRGARRGLNPRTGEPLLVGPSASVNFKPSNALKKALNPDGVASQPLDLDDHDEMEDFSDE